MAMSWSAPSASRSSCMARSVQSWVSASVKSGSGGVIPLAPLAISVTVSLVDMQPSESSRSKLTRVAARSAGSRSAAGTTASVVRTTSIVASCGASMPAPLAIPPTDQPAPSTTACLLTESVVMIASAAPLPAVGRQPVVRRVDAGEQVLAVVGEADQPGRADDDVDRADADLLGDPLGDRVRGLEAVGAGVAVGAAGVEHDGAHDAVLDDLLAPQHRVGQAAVGGEDAGGVEPRAVVDDQRDVLARRWTSGRPATPWARKPGGGGDAHAGVSWTSGGDGGRDLVPGSSPCLLRRGRRSRRRRGSSRCRTSTA